GRRGTAGADPGRRRGYGLVDADGGGVGSGGLIRRTRITQTAAPMATSGATCIAAVTPARRNDAATSAPPNHESISQPQITNDAVAATGAPIASATPTTKASILEPRAAVASPAPSNA